MQTLSRPSFGAILFIAGAVASVIVLQFPWFSYLMTFVIWTALRAPETIGVGGILNISPARSLSEAAYEGLWAATGLVFGVTLSFEVVKAFL